MTHQVDGGYVISSHHVWLPGIYDSERTARSAFRFPVATLQALSDRICNIHGENRSIARDDLAPEAPRLTATPGDGAAWCVGDDVLVRYMEKERRGVIVEIEEPPWRRPYKRHAWVVLNGTDKRLGYRLDELTRPEATP